MSSLVSGLPALATLPYRDAGFFPSQLTAVTAWLRFAGATTSSGDYTSVPDVLASNPATQATSGQRPTAGTSANGYPTCTFVRADPNSLSWPKATNNNSTQKWGFATWVKATTYPAQAYLFDFGGATARYDNERINLFFNSSRTIFLEVFGQDSGAYNGRVGQASFAAPTTGTWFFLRVAFDGTQGTEAGRIKIYVNEGEQTLSFTNNGSGGTPVVLRTNAENVAGVIGNFTDNTDGSIAFNGSIGPNVYIMSDNLTAAQGLDLMAFERPT